MNVSHISKTAWEIFEKRYPDAAAFLRHEELHGEVCSLKWKRSGPGLSTDWEVDRLKELEELEMTWAREEES